MLVDTFFSSKKWKSPNLEAASTAEEFKETSVDKSVFSLTLPNTLPLMMCMIPFDASMSGTTTLASPIDKVNGDLET